MRVASRQKQKVLLESVTVSEKGANLNTKECKRKTFDQEG